MEGIQVSISKTGPQNNISVIKVGGYIDTTTSAELERALDRLLKSNNYNIVVDLGNVDYISSAGWGIFISEIKGIREKKGDLKLVNMIPDVYEVFELLEFHYILKAFDSLEEAVRDFQMDTVPGEFSPPAETAPVETSRPSAAVEFSEEQVAETVRTQTETLKNLSLPEKIKKVVLEKPDASLLEIKKALNTEKYGFTKIGIVRLLKELGKLGLRSKKSRVKFFKKTAF